MPEIDDDVQVEIREEDIKMDVYRASGAGGQKVNKPLLPFVLLIFLQALLYPARLSVRSIEQRGCNENA